MLERPLSGHPVVHPQEQQKTLLSLTSDKLTKAAWQQLKVSYDALRQAEKCRCAAGGGGGGRNGAGWGIYREYQGLLGPARRRRPMQAAGASAGILPDFGDPPPAPL